MENNLFSSEAIAEIGRILKKGNTVEIKKVNGALVIVEIQRKVKNRTSITG